MGDNICAVVLGGYVNGYSIIQELYQFKVKNIALLHYGGQIASYSNKLTDKLVIGNDKERLLQALLELKKKYDKLVLFPTDDLLLENLHAIKEQLKEFCFLPFNTDNLLTVIDKKVQYEFCEKLGVPFPKTISIKEVKDLERLSTIALPILIKPNKREDLREKVFRSLRIESKSSLQKNKNKLEKFVKKGMTFIASEIIPGDTNGSIYAYTGYRSPNSKNIENEWTGRKLTQFPDDYGVFSSASNEAPKIIREQGRKLLNGMDLYGICEPEFKYDYRDGLYKLMEINLRSMMWHRVGNLSGVHLQYTQWCDAVNAPIKREKQVSETVHFCYLKHEVINLLFRKGYYRYFRSNLKHSKTSLGLWDKKDMFPFVIDQFGTVKEIGKLMVKKIIGRQDA
ncbi:carboxylate--amine ligase [Sinomicrobium sp.]